MKLSGEDLKMVRTAPTRPQPPSRPIKKFEKAAGPKVDAMSPGAPKQADQLQSSEQESTGGIDPRQMHY
jgi:hypothetical protein